MKQDIKTTFQALVYKEFGADELNVYKSFCINAKKAYSTDYKRVKAKKESPSEWLARKKKGLSINDEIGKLVSIEFDSSELEYYKNLNSKHKFAYSAYMRLRIKANKEIISNDSPSKWHKRFLARKAGVKQKREHYIEKRKDRQVALTEFVKSIAEMFSYDESMYYSNMINFARKYYRKHYLQCEKHGYSIRSPSEWYNEFAVTTQCKEMQQLENRFFALVKGNISRQDAKEYIAYFEAMAYQKERNYCL
ncbi:hypothetical protein [Helicobacter bilis]|uniref:hypothetical protein n=1 Tax=Helicobacter bilis TaxID=37372 RepID=UPI00051DBBB2|nr:hypothetical protein [Helicobacter bilis]TLE08381.1 hypothetical protein LS78_005580 [Helicobacter bilis]